MPSEIGEFDCLQFGVGKIAKSCSNGIAAPVPRITLDEFIGDVRTEHLVADRLESARCAHLPTTTAFLLTHMVDRPAARQHHHERAEPTAARIDVRGVVPQVQEDFLGYVLRSLTIDDNSSGHCGNPIAVRFEDCLQGTCISITKSLDEMEFVVGREGRRSHGSTVATTVDRPLSTRCPIADDH